MPQNNSYLFILNFIKNDIFLLFFNTRLRKFLNGVKSVQFGSLNHHVFWEMTALNKSFPIL